MTTVPMFLDEAVSRTELHNRARRLSPQTWGWITQKLSHLSRWCQERDTGSMSQEMGR